MDFSDHLAALDRDVQDHLCDDAIYTDDDGREVPVRIMLDHPRAADQLSGMAFTRGRPIIRVARASCPDLREGHTFKDRRNSVWEVAEAPTADGDGRWWRFEVQPG